MKQVVKNKKLKKSSQDWMRRQLNDPYVAQAQKLGYRSRAAFKLIEIQKKFKLINKDSVVVDLGAAPGGWSQIASKICKNVIAIDLLEMPPLPNVSFIQGDFLDKDNMDKIENLLNNKKADVIISDMAPNTCGIKKVDHLRIINLIEEVFEFCKQALNPGGSLVVKVFQGGTIPSLLNQVKLSFDKVYHFKPSSSRKESSEFYMIAIGYKSTD